LALRFALISLVLPCACYPNQNVSKISTTTKNS
jgi:hypothetical protein